MKRFSLKNKNSIWNNLFPYIFTLIFLIVSIILITRHEFWRDEVKAWLTGSASNSIAEFIKNMRDSQGHPYIWSFIFYLISHFINNNLEIMKIVSMAVSTTTTFLILKFAPFNKIFKIGIIFSYFLFYEYSIISRNYSFGILFIFVFCILFKNRYKNIILLSIVLFLIMQGSLYSFFISLALFAYSIYVFSVERDEVKKIKRIYIFIALAIVIAGIVFEYWQLGSQATGFNTFSPNIFNFFKKSISLYVNALKITSIAIVTAFLPLSSFKINFWNSNLIVDFLIKYSPVYICVVAILLFLIPLLFIKRKVIILYVSGFLFIAFIPFFIYAGFTRHYGHFFIFLIVCLWLSEYFAGNKFIIFHNPNLNKKIFNIFLTIILSISFLNTINAFYHDYKYQFSAGKDASDYISKNFTKNNIVIVGYQDIAAEAISGYLDKPLYYPQSKDGIKLRKLVSWEDRSWDYFSINKVICESLNFIGGDKKLILAISQPNLNFNKELEKLCFKEIYNSNGNSIVENENFALYIFNKKVQYIYNINSSNYKDALNPLNDCKFQKDNSSITIKISGNDPSFEIKFPFDINNKLFIIRVNDFVSDISGEFSIYFKRFGKTYSENDKQSIKVSKGLDSFYFLIDNSKDLEQIRIDPTNIKENCQFKSIDIFELEN